MLKNIFLITLILAFFIISTVDAQVGWQWGRAGTNVGGSSLTEASPSAVDKFGNLILSGAIAGYDSVQFGSNYIQGDGVTTFVTKVDASGNYLWTIASSTGTPGQVQPASLATDDSGNIYLLGAYFTQFTLGSIHLTSGSRLYPMKFLAKISSSGTVLWMENLAFCTNTLGQTGLPMGFIGVDSNFKVYVINTFNQDSLVLGTTSFTNPFGSGDHFYIAKFNNDGSNIWAENFISDVGFLTGSIDNGGNIYISFGSFNDTFAIGSHTIVINPYFGGDIFTKIDNNGNLVWAMNNTKFSIYAITTDIAGNIYGAGSLGSSAVIGGDTLIKHSPTSDMLVAKYLPTGDFVHAWNAGGDSQQNAASITIDLCGNIWVAVSVHGSYINSDISSYTIHFNTDSFYIPPTGGKDVIVLSEFDTSGNYLSSTWLPSGGDDGISVLSDSRGSIFIAGDYEDKQMIIANDTLPFPPGLMEEDFFIAKYKYDTAICRTEQVLSIRQGNIVPVYTINVYPNPASYECTVSNDIPFPENTKVEIYDVTGRLINAYPLSGKNTSFSVAHFSPGIYTCRIFIGDQSIITKKLVVVK